MISLTLLVAVGVTVIIEFVRSLGPQGPCVATSPPFSIPDVSIPARFKEGRIAQFPTAALLSYWMRVDPMRCAPAVRMFVIEAEVGGAAGTAKFTQAVIGQLPRTERSANRSAVYIAPFDFAHPVGKNVVVRGNRTQGELWRQLQTSLRLRILRQERSSSRSRSPAVKRASASGSRTLSP